MPIDPLQKLGAEFFEDEIAITKGDYDQQAEIERAAAVAPSAHTTRAPSEQHVDPLRGIDPDWESKKECLGLDPNVFITPEGEDENDPSPIAVAACGACAVRSECLETIIKKFPKIKGYVGGMTEKERGSLIRRRKKMGLA